MSDEQGELMDAELERLAAEGARVLVGAVAREGWRSVVGRFQSPFSGRLSDAQFALDDPGENRCAAELLRLLDDDPAFAPELRSFIEDASLAPGTRNLVSGGVTETLVQAGSIGSLTVNSPPGPSAANGQSGGAHAGQRRIREGTCLFGLRSTLDAAGLRTPFPCTSWTACASTTTR
ncbi:hypothetical protein [Streptomyces sp. NBC_00878]|uniref:hypothetical protein n=1 Tax=Streptomyces sp. NBC_00878 TaxID=2975854 RepID=UPI00225950DD|nr:hypothetical protein [Streptomyces sp. NBC_00878]MCX4906137.1 hypothetical protein [Streptomyces sp. NBC_00878]